MINETRKRNERKRRRIKNQIKNQHTLKSQMATSPSIPVVENLVAPVLLPVWRHKLVIAFWCSVPNEVSLDDRACRSRLWNFFMALTPLDSFFVEISNFPAYVTIELPSTPKAIGQHPWPWKIKGWSRFLLKIVFDPTEKFNSEWWA